MDEDIECNRFLPTRRQVLLSQECRTGATLIEILVVIGILAILIAILLPMLFRSRQQAYATQCVSNMEQLGSAFAMYVQDWDEWMPSPGGLMGNYAYWSQSGMGGLEVYIRQSGLNTIWCCPRLKSWNGRYAPRSYSMNSYLRRPPDIEYPTSIYLLGGVDYSVIEEPADTILLFEGLHLAAGYEDKVEYIYRCGNWTCVSGYADGILYTVNSGRPWHLTTNNYLYSDGHIKARPPGRRTTGLRSSWKEMREWYVSKKYFYQRYGESP